MSVHVICEKHHVTVLVGLGSLLGEYECPTCIDDRDAANEWRPCCPYMNTTCCGHDDDDAPRVLVEITSPNYCDDEHRDPEEVPF